MTITTGPDRTMATARATPEAPPSHWSPPGLTAGSATVVAAVIMALASAVDTMTSDPLGPTSTALFLAGVCVLVPLLIRRPLSVTPVALPPLAWAAAATLAAVSSGQNSGQREVALDVGTMLTITAPVLFGGTLLAVLIVLARLALRVAARVRSAPTAAPGSGDAGSAHVPAELRR